jgi:hypothetical protein
VRDPFDTYNEFGASHQVLNQVVDVFDRFVQDFYPPHKKLDLLIKQGSVGGRCRFFRRQTAGQAQQDLSWLRTRVHL